MTIHHPNSILEIATLQVISDQTNAFLKNFSQAEKIISRQPGYLSHHLLRKTDPENHFILLVSWESVSAHKEGFRKSKDYQEWKALLHHFYDPFPTVDYYTDR